MLEVGKNSYITAAEADATLQHEALGVTWLNLPICVKEEYLLLAAARIDSIAYRGHKCKDMSFPRTGQKCVPYAVRLAQALEACAELDAGANERREAVENGLRSVSVGNTSETYSSRSSSYALGGVLKSRKALDLLRPYILGSAVII